MRRLKKQFVHLQSDFDLCRENGGRVLSNDGSAAVGANAIGATHHPYRIVSPRHLLPRRSWPFPIQRCQSLLSFSSVGLHFVFFFLFLIVCSFLETLLFFSSMRRRAHSSEHMPLRCIHGSFPIFELTYHCHGFCGFSGNWKNNLVYFEIFC